MKNVLLATLASVLALGCEAPPVFATADTRGSPSVSRIEGQVVVAGQARGNVALFLFDAARPPPPAGFGRPLTFSTVPASALFAHAVGTDTGPFTAPFAFSLVAPGQYLIRGFVDVGDDFIPWYSVTAEANQGDVGGADVDPLTAQSRVVEVPQTLAPALDVPVSFSPTATVPVNRPAFAEASGAISATVGSAPRVVELKATPIEQGPVHQGQPVFLAQFIDANHDGVPDDANGDGVPEMWPKVVVRKLADGDNLMLDENDLNRDGVLDADGTGDYDHVNPANGQTVPADGQPDLVVLAAGFDPTDLAPLLLDSMGQVKTTPTAVTSLKLVIKPQAIDLSNPAAPAPLKSMPPGRYAITLIQLTGQTWRVPNELAPSMAPGLSLPTVDSQGFVVQVP